MDSNVIFSRVLHELFGRLGTAGRFDLIWSEELLGEARRVIRDRKPTTDEVAVRWVSYLRDAFPAGRVEIQTVDPTIDFRLLTEDPADHHVCALVIAGRADAPITSDAGFGGRTHLSAPLRIHGVDVRTPDDFLRSDVDDGLTLYAEIVRAQAQVWSGGRSLRALIDAYERAGAVSFAVTLRERL